MKIEEYICLSIIAELKLIIQIPCFNEEHTLKSVIDTIPDSIPTIDTIEILVIDDGSTDQTSIVAQELGVHHLIRNSSNLGLGTSFQIGMNYAYANDADILVNTDGDNQYASIDIPKLIQPILSSDADIVIGNRQTSTINHFSALKKILQFIGTKAVQTLIRESEIKDAVSGFRAYNRNAMRKINVTSTFSYVLDTTIQSKIKGLSLTSVDIKTNPPTRPSRLFKSNFQHVRKSTIDIFRIYIMYRAMRVFFTLGAITLILGMIPMIRFLVDFFWGTGGNGKIQSLIFGSTFILIGIILFALGVIADLLNKNRMLIERVIEQEKGS